MLGPIHEGARQMPAVGGVTAVGGQAGDDVDDLQVLQPLQLVAALAQHELCKAAETQGRRGTRGGVNGGKRLYASRALNSEEVGGGGDVLGEVLVMTDLQQHGGHDELGQVHHHKVDPERRPATTQASHTEKK